VRTTTRRLGILLVVALAGLVTASAATATSVRPVDRHAARGHGNAATALPTKVARALERGSTAGAERAAVSAARRGVSAQLAAGEFEGFAYCGNDIAFVWPADAGSHQLTITRTFALFSPMGDFSDTQVVPSDAFVVQIGTDFVFLDATTLDVVYGPTNYADAWGEWDFMGDGKVVFVNQIITVDNNVAAAPEFVVLQALGTSVVTAPNVCQP
jgi:hypothetical protein